MFRSQHLLQHLLLKQSGEIHLETSKLQGEKKPQLVQFLERKWQWTHISGRDSTNAKHSKRHNHSWSSNWSNYVRCATIPDWKYTSWPASSPIHQFRFLCSHGRVLASFYAWPLQCVRWTYYYRKKSNTTKPILRLQQMPSFSTGLSIPHNDTNQWDKCIETTTINTASQTIYQINQTSQKGPPCLTYPQVLY